MAKIDATRKQEALEQLRKIIPQGSTVYCTVKRVSRSGMSRNIDFYAIVPNGVNDKHEAQQRIQWLTGYMSSAGIVNQSRKDWEQSKGARVNGCGMDMGFHVVESMAAVLYGRESNGIGRGLKHEWL